MKMHELNPRQEETVLLLPPMLATAEQMGALLARPMGQRYRFLIPDLSGHGAAAGETYRSAEREAEAIRAYLADRQIGTLRLAFGASVGGVVLMELLRGRGFSAERLWFEGVSFFEDSGARCDAVKQRLLAGRSQAQSRPDRAEETLGRLFGQRVKHSMCGQLAGLSTASLEHMVEDCSHVRLPTLTEAVQRRCLFAYGQRDGDLQEARRLQPERYPASELRVWSGHGHCTAFTEDPAAYAALLVDWMNGTAPREREGDHTIGEKDRSDGHEAKL